MPSIASCVLVPSWPPLLSSCLPRWHPPIPPPGFSVQLSLHPLGEDTVSAAPLILLPEGCGTRPSHISSALCLHCSPGAEMGSMGEFGVTNLALDSGDAPGDGWGTKHKLSPIQSPTRAGTVGPYLPWAWTQGGRSPGVCWGCPTLLQDPCSWGFAEDQCPLVPPCPMVWSHRTGVRQGGQPAAMVAELLPGGLQEPDGVHNGAVQPLHRPPREGQWPADTGREHR